LTEENSPRLPLFFLETGSEELNGCCEFFRTALKADKLPSHSLKAVNGKSLT